MNLVGYFRDVAAELRKVSWPTVPVVVRNFLAVVIGLALATLLIGGFDLIFLKLLGFIIK